MYGCVCTFGFLGGSQRDRAVPHVPEIVCYVRSLATVTIF